MPDRQIGNYRIVEYLGSGGFGSVFKAEDISSPGRIVAIKELHRKHSRSTTIKQRFFQEAVAMARLDHPNLPRLYTFGEDGGCYYLVMELVSGILLSEEIERSGSLPPARAIHLLTQVLEAVGYAHRNGIIHRDLKPENIMITDRDRIKVLDFGIARMVGGEHITITGEGFGTPNYMSPERVAGQSSIDQRADIYSLGIILFETLTGKVPFRSTATDPAVFWSEMRRLHESEPLPSLSSLGIPPELEAVVRKAAAKSVEDRYATADEMLLALRGDRASSQLYLIISPSEAEVFVDNIPRGTSDHNGRLLVESLTPGIHNVRVEKPGFNSYRIDVSIESGRHAELQVQLAARATVAIPAVNQSPQPGQSGSVTLPDTPGLQPEATLPLENPSFNSRTPSAPATLTGIEDVRATVSNFPGAREAGVAPPATNMERAAVLTDAAVTPRTVRTEPARPTSSRPPTPQPESRAEISRIGRRIAIAAVVVIMLALAAVSYLVLKGPARRYSSRQTEPEKIQTAGLSNQPSPSPAGTANSNRSQTTPSPQSNSNSAAPQKRDEINGPQARPEETGQIPPASTRESGTQGEPARGDACLGVNVVGPDGRPGAAVRVVCIEKPGSLTPVFHRGITADNGTWQECGFSAGSKVKIGVFGPGGAVLAGRLAFISPGRNFVTIQLPNNSGNNPEWVPLRPQGRRFKRLD